MCGGTSLEDLGVESDLIQIEYWVYGDLTIMYPKPYSIYLRGSPNVLNK